MTVVLGPDVTVDGLVSQVQLEAMLPNTPTIFTSANVINILDNEMRRSLMPLIKKLKEEFWVTNYDQNVISGQVSYQIPYRAMGQSLRDVVLVDNNGNEIQLVRYEPEDIKFPLLPYGSPYFPLGFYLKDNSVNLFPTVAAQYTTYVLRMKYERRPSSLISKNSCGYITASNSIAKTVALNFVPTAWNTSSTVDIINNLPPFNSVLDDTQITNISGNTLTLSSFPTTIDKNFYVAPSMSTPIPQLPFEAFPLLVLYGVKKVLSAMGDQGAKNIDEDIKSEINLFQSMMIPRVEGAVKTLSNRSGVFSYGRSTFGNWGN